MEQNKNVTKLRNKLFYEFNNDGILEMIVGISVVSRLLIVDNIMFYLLLLSFFFLRSKLTGPRIGIVCFKMFENFWKIIILAVISYLLMYAFFSIIFFKNIHMLMSILILITFLLFLIIANLIDRYYGFKRAYFILFLFFIGTFVAPFLKPYLGSRYCEMYLTIIPGGILLFYGLFHLIRFLKKYHLDNIHG